MEEKIYNLHLNNFEGPIEILLDLVKTKKIDILNIDLVELANEYIKIINKIKNNNIDLASEYLVMATSLLQIKARALLETPKSVKFVEKAKENILKKMIEHQKFKNVFKILKEKEIKRQNIFIKKHSPIKDFQYEIDESYLDGNLDAINIIMFLRKMFERTNARIMRKATIEEFKFSPTERRKELIEILKRKKNVNFKDIFSTSSINYFVVTIITILDMSRKQELIISQNEQFGEIIIKKGVINEL